MKEKKILPPVGLEPITFEIEVQHASPLRHRGCGKGTMKKYLLFSL